MRTLTAASLAVLMSAAALANQNAFDSPDAHVALAKTAAGGTYQNLFNFLCTVPASTSAQATADRPRGGGAGAGGRRGGGPPPGPPDRSTWHAEPVKVFDNLLAGAASGSTRNRWLPAARGSSAGPASSVPKPVRRGNLINLLAPDNGCQLVVAQDAQWAATVDGDEASHVRLGGNVHDQRHVDREGAVSVVHVPAQTARYVKGARAHVSRVHRTVPSGACVGTFSAG